MRATRTIFALILREMTMTSARSALGYLWEILEPAVGILLLTLIFGLFLRSPPIGHNFPLFYASGLLPFIMFVDLSNKVATSVRVSRPLLTYPGVTYLDAVIARFLLGAITKLLIFALVLGGIVLMYDISPLFDYGNIMLGLGLALMLALSVGLVNCLLFHYFPLWDRLWTLVNRPLLIISGIIVLVETIPQPYRDWLAWNPIVHMVGVLRMGIYPTYQPGYVSVTYLVGIIAVLLPTGLFFMRRYWRDLVDPSA